MRPALRLVVVALALAALPGCALLRNLSQGLRAPVATFQSAELGTISLEAATVNAQFRLDNPNPIGVDIAQIEWDFLFEGQKLFGGSAPAGLRLAPSGSAPLPVQVLVPWTGAAKLAQVMASGQEEVAYQVVGRVGVQTPVGPMSVPIGWAGKLPVPRLPTLTVASASFREVTLVGARAVVVLAVENRNGFPLPLEGASLRLLANNRVLATSAVAPRALAPRQVSQVELPVDIAFLQAGAAVMSAATQRNLAVRLQGEAKVAGKALPVDLAATLR